MPELARGHRTSTFEILDLLAVDHESLSIVVRHAAANAPETFTLPVTGTPAARQVLDAMAQSLVTASDSDADSRWTSRKTLEKGMWTAAVMLRSLQRQGIDSFADSRVTVAGLRQLYAPFSSSGKRSACWLLARAVRNHHPNGRQLAYILKNSRFETEDHEAFTYDVEVAAAIEKVGRRVFLDAYVAQRKVFETIGLNVAGRAWLRVPAEEVIAWATTTYPDVRTVGEEPADAEQLVRKIAWAVSHPEWFGYRKHARQPLVRGREMRLIGQALYPDNVTLVGAAIVHCLGEHAGFNLSVILEKSADSLTYVGENEALERSIKARGSTEDTRATRLNSLFTAGGVTETLTGLTRFARRHRALVGDDDRRSPMNDRLYVEHVVDPSAARILGPDRIHNAWRSAVFAKAWTTEAGSIEMPGLRMPALRLEAQRRTMDEGLTADVHGHNENTKTHYLAHVLPEHLFNELATAAQDAFHDDVVGKFQRVADATDGPAAVLAAVDPAQVMDVEIGVCASGGNAPGSDRRCDLGMVACFTCRNGFRMVDHVPGLLAAVEFADIVEANDPDEWANGQASDLRFYAQESLNAFPRPVVANIAASTDLAPHILTVTGMYMEMRHG